MYLYIRVYTFFFFHVRIFPRDYFRRIIPCSYRDPSFLRIQLNSELIKYVAAGEEFRLGLRSLEFYGCIISGTFFLLTGNSTAVQV